PGGFFFSSRRRHTRSKRDWSSDVCSSDLKAIQQVDYQWIMFYPCIYMFAIWDAYKDAGGGGPYAFLPFVFAAYFGTIGVIYSSEILGPGSYLVADYIFDFRFIHRLWHKRDNKLEEKRSIGNLSCGYG